MQLPDWWEYPAQCEHGHEWGPGRVIVSWVHCRCGPALAAVGGRGPAGHQVVPCRADGCQSRWHRPRHELEESNIRYASLCGGLVTPSQGPGNDSVRLFQGLIKAREDGNETVEAGNWP